MRNLKELQKLSYSEATQGSHILRELGDQTQLQKLGISYLQREYGAELCSCIAKMSHLRSFSTASMSMDELLDLQSSVSPPPTLERLYLRGPLHTLPPWVGKLENLIRMRLRCSRLQEYSLRVLQALPNLIELTLLHAYDGMQIRCERGGFRKLQILDLEQLNNLHSVIINGAMPNLRMMYIRACVQLEMVPLSIEQLANLIELHMFDMPEVLVKRLRSTDGIDHQKVRKIPIIRCYDNQDWVSEEL